MVSCRNACLYCRCYVASLLHTHTNHCKTTYNTRKTKGPLPPFSLNPHHVPSPCYLDGMDKLRKQSAVAEGNLCRVEDRLFSHTHTLTHSHTHALTHSHTHTLTHSHTTHSHTHTLTHSQTHKLTHSQSNNHTNEALPRVL